ncbi:hypothetical protein [Butyrivibrio sp. YAB3001]|uniref:hypothetical protein n=1 Tax=Butyrivibrio sp. YAB3001 TaxID=1520812 RepID=UPI0008F68AAD|nr:hypothetical protein [Butyrivibrio sp. YAB3001]SFB69258.1 hypothetical protein SAMN02910398_00269 [Butyrivibrio sp. YAB3001]
MKLKRMWPGICILIVFFIFDVIMVASSSFFSGLFPSDDMLLAYSGIFTVISVLIMSVLTLLMRKICDHLDTRHLSEKIGFRIVYVVILIAILVGGTVYRVFLLSHTTAVPSGKLSLYENAMVGAVTSTVENDLLSIVYSTVLKGILFFTGNNLSVAFFYEIGLFMLFVLLGAIACRLLLGKCASIVFAGFVSFMPIFDEHFVKAVIGTDELFLTLFGIELLLVAIYLKKASDGKYSSKLHIIWYMVVGIVVGFMAYVDVGTFVAILPLLLSVLFLLEKENSGGILSLIILLAFGMLSFFGMIIQEAGIYNVDITLQNWGRYFFRNLNTFSMYWTYTNYKVVYLVTLVVMSGVLLGYFRNREFENVSPWLLSTILIFVATPFLGATRMNDQLILTIYFAFVLACVAALITTNENMALAEAKSEDITDSVESEEQMLSGVQEVVTPAAKEVSDLANEPEYYDDEPEYSHDEGMEASGVETKENSNAKFIDAEHDTTFSQYIASSEKEEILPEAKKQVESACKEEVRSDIPDEKPRFVPEGMVLPVGSEDEMDIERPKMKMPEFEGMIALDRKEKVKPKKDDFDIPFKEGDDFDI